MRRSKTIAVVLALFLGGLGAHLYYTGRPFRATLYLLFCWTLVPSFLALIDAALILAGIQKVE